MTRRLPAGWVVTRAVDDSDGGLIAISSPHGTIELSKLQMWVSQTNYRCPSIDIDTLRLLADTSDLMALVGAERAAERMLGYRRAA